MKLPEINLHELQKIKKENFKERLEFQDRYVEWMKMTNNVKWSAAQKAMINRKSEGPPKRTHTNSSTARSRSAKRRSKN